MRDRTGDEIAAAPSGFKCEASDAAAGLLVRVVVAAGEKAPGSHSFTF